MYSFYEEIDSMVCELLEELVRNKVEIRCIQYERRWRQKEIEEVRAENERLENKKEQLMAEIERLSAALKF